MVVDKRPNDRYQKRLLSIYSTGNISKFARIKEVLLWKNSNISNSNETVTRRLIKKKKPNDMISTVNSRN